MEELYCNFCMLSELVKAKFKTTAKNKTICTVWFVVYKAAINSRLDLKFHKINVHQSVFWICIYLY